MARVRLTNDKYGGHGVEQHSGWSSKGPDDDSLGLRGNEGLVAPPLAVLTLFLGKGVCGKKQGPLLEAFDHAIKPGLAKQPHARQEFHSRRIGFIHKQSDGESVDTHGHSHES